MYIIYTLMHRYPQIYKIHCRRADEIQAPALSIYGKCILFCSVTSKHSSDSNREKTLTIR